MRLGTSSKHLSMDWRGGTWKQIRMYTESNSQLRGMGGSRGPFKKLFHFELPFQFRPANQQNQLKNNVLFMAVLLSLKLSFTLCVSRRGCKPLCQVQSLRCLPAIYCLLFLDTTVVFAVIRQCISDIKCRSLRLKPDRSTQQVPGQPELCSETLSKRGKYIFLILTLA